MLSHLKPLIILFRYCKLLQSKFFNCCNIKTYMQTTIYIAFIMFSKMLKLFHCKLYIQNGQRVIFHSLAPFFSTKLNDMTNEDKRPLTTCWNSIISSSVHHCSTLIFVYIKGWKNVHRSCRISSRSHTEADCKLGQGGQCIRQGGHISGWGEPWNYFNIL